MRMRWVLISSCADLEGVLGVERAFPPGGFALGVAVDGDPGAEFPGLGNGCGDGSSGFGIVVEEGAGDVGAASDCSDADLDLVAPEVTDRFVDAPECCLGLAAAGRQRGGGARLGDGGGVHAISRSAVSVVLAMCSSSWAVSARSAARNAVDHTRWK